MGGVHLALLMAGLSNRRVPATASFDKLRMSGDVLRMSGDVLRMSGDVLRMSGGVLRITDP